MSTQIAQISSFIESFCACVTPDIGLLFRGLDKREPLFGGGARLMEAKKLLTRLQKQRSAINGDEFPIYQSLIGYSLFLLLCHYELRGERARLKDIYVELERSQGGVRRLVKSLETDGWIELMPDGDDRRSRVVKPTPRLQRAIARFVELVHLGV